MKNKDINILKFQPKPKEILTNDEIDKVFAGLVRLIQKSAEYNAYEKAKSKINYYNKRLNETMIELNKRNLQIEELLKLNEELISKLNDKNKAKIL